MQDFITANWVMPGLGDAGVHVGQTIDCGWGTFVLSHWHRDRELYSLAEAVRRITAEPARPPNLDDRVVLAIGMKADISVINLNKLTERMPEFVYNFPGGSAGFIQWGKGYRASVCNGTIVLQDGQLLGVRAGQVIRNSV